MILRRPRLIALILVLSMILAFAWWITLPLRASAQSVAVSINKVQGVTWRPELGQPLFILVLGSDARVAAPDGGGGRCDAIHIVGINPKTKTGTVLNFPRDSYVPVVGFGTTKLNSACTKGGAPNMVATLKSLTGIPIQYYAITEFSHFVRFIDELGGVDVNVPYRMRDTFSGADFPAGPYHMNGSQTLAFSRNRHDTPAGDFSRTFNQGTVVVSGLAKFKNDASADPSKIFDYIRVARRNVSSSVPVNELIKLALFARDVDPAGLVNMNVPGSAGSAGAASVVYLSPGDTYNRIRDDAIY